MKIPEGVSDNDLDNMGGNMMHLQTVGVALLLALSLVNWDDLAAQAAQEVSAAQAAPARKRKGLSKKKAQVHEHHSSLEKQRQQNLKARFGMIARKVTKPSQIKPAKKSKRIPKYRACLRGTRWAC